MKPVVGIAILLLFCILACGCTGQPPASSPLAKNQAGEHPTNPTTPATAAPTTGSVISILSDSHNETKLSLDPGVIIVAFQAQDAQFMHISLYSSGTVIPDNYAEAATFSTTGPYNGSVAFKIPKKGEYLLNIKSWGGNWIAEVSRLSGDTPLKVPLNFSGAGMMVTPAFYLEKGEYIFGRNETMLTSPWFYLQYANGSSLIDPNNTYVQPGFGVASPETFRFVSIPESGTYFLSVYSDKSPNNWSVSIITLPEIPLSLGPGPVITQVKGNGTP